MQIPAPLFTAALWLALAAVASGATYLLLVLTKEWRRGQLW